MMKPNIKPIFRGSKLVPRTSPRPAIATQAIGTSVTMIHQCRAMCACTPDAWTTEAIGSTMTADSTPWAAPESTLAMATSQMGQGQGGWRVSVLWCSHIGLDFYQLLPLAFPQQHLHLPL